MLASDVVSRAVAWSRCSCLAVTVKRLGVDDLRTARAVVAPDLGDTSAALCNDVELGG
jgi:hypothetical protein